MSRLPRLAPYALLATALLAQAPPAWHDPSPHRVQFITVEPGVRLEVLDWGGTGRPIVLLAGSGNSAHVFDEFAPKLAVFAHVYGITRRGFGSSSQPATGYDDQRLADDVLRVLDSLQLRAPILVGHSMAGGELTTLGAQHSDRLGGLVYLDALGDPRDWPGTDPVHRELAQKLPQKPPPPPPTEDETRVFAAYRARQLRNEGFAFPESELRAGFETNPDGTMGRYKSPRSIFDAIGEGQKKRDYSKIRVPVLAFFEFPRNSNDPPPKNDQERAAIDAFTANITAYVNRWTTNLKSAVPSARLIDLPGAGHYLFLTREAEVLSGLRAFLDSL